MSAFRNRVQDAADTLSVLCTREAGWIKSFIYAGVCMFFFALGYVSGRKSGGLPATPPQSVLAPLNCSTNIVDNGLAAWISDTNHTFGPQMGKRIFILEHGGKFWIRFRQSETNEFETLLVSDRPYNSAEQARYALAVNMHLQMKKATSDAIEDAFK